uniref:Vta1/callose synthase N-terminal domain-containing protein n=1 Tax=Alexandrium catenella TaxID=2925 RepID=A0A7S1QRN0_ALECA|mmetsp:Transcript_37305/g.100952  ORF Transcript_37305/g.100952 Transcript_37305/m.100952 type:complete len:264 (+) Transcript_37305:101-892(+)
MSAAVRRCRPFLQRAEELAAHHPVIGHYCRVYAVDLLARARQGGDASAELQAVLLQELGKAEGAKKSLDLSDGREAMESFTLGVFERVNAADSAGSADAGTASQYYVAGLFLEACAQFYGGELPPDLAEKARFAKYRAVHIRDCLRRGVAPDAPGAASAPAPQESLAGPAAATGAPAPAAAGLPAATGPVAAAGATASSAGAASLAGGSTVAAASVALPRSADPWLDAKKQAEYAASALDFSDVGTARTCLLEVLRLLDSCDG